MGNIQKHMSSLQKRFGKTYIASIADKDATTYDDFIASLKKIVIANGYSKNIIYSDNNWCIYQRLCRHIRKQQVKSFNIILYHDNAYRPPYLSYYVKIPHHRRHKLGIVQLQWDKIEIDTDK